jgi:hypothetical protein
MPDEANGQIRLSAALYIGRKGDRLVDEEAAALFRLTRDATNMEIAVARLLARCWRFKVGCVKFIDRCAVRPLLLARAVIKSRLLRTVFSRSADQPIATG